MTISSDFGDMLPHTVTIYNLDSEDDYGNPTWDGGTSYSCRIVRKPHMVRDLNGDQTVAGGIAYLESNAKIDPRWRAVDETISPEEEYFILSTATYPDENGNYYTELHFR